MEPLSSSPEPIAIIGSGCRLPGGATSPSKLWELLRDPRDLLKDIGDAGRYPVQGFHNDVEDHHGTSNTSKAYLYDGNHLAFDHGFFNLHIREAASMDPQQRMLLEVVYEALESAGLSIHTLQGSQTSVFLGQMTDDHRDNLYHDIDNVPQYTATGVSRAIMANRVSHFFDWHGPSLNLDTACSSSLVALHYAVQALRNGTSQVSVAAGVNIILGPETFIVESKLHMLSSSGRCRMWDAEADGYARGEGVSVLILKTLRQALLDHDSIECVIRDTGVNHNGRTPGLTTPSVSAQVALIKSTYESCGLDLSNERDLCQYFEAHGTGTAAGDPREAEAIRNAFFSPAQGRDNPPPREDSWPTDHSRRKLYVGSAKTVLGHSEGAAGLVGVLKASLAIQNREIPPNMHFNRLSSTVEPFYDPNLEVPTRAHPWPRLDPGVPRRASVNSFGFGGTNAHAILESWEPEETQLCPIDMGESREVYGPFPVSAQSPVALRRQVAALHEELERHSDPCFGLGDLAFTLQRGRTELNYRVSFSADTRSHLAEKLQKFLLAGEVGGGSPEPATVLSTKNYPIQILGVFTGQGAQWQGMGAQMLTQSPVFRGTIRHLEESLAELPDAPSWSMRDLLLASNDDGNDIHKAELSQPLTTAVQIGLVDLLGAAGIRCAALVGHSSGEIAAAYASGLLSARDAIRVAYYRGLHAYRARSSTQRATGSMLAVGLAYQEAQSLCAEADFADKIHVAASNSPLSSTISGDLDVIHKAKRTLEGRGTFAKLLKVDQAYHSPHVESCVPGYLESMERCGVAKRPINESSSFPPWYSSVYGSDGRCSDLSSTLDNGYWAENMRKPVLFQQAIERVIKEHPRCIDLALELGPHPALKAPVTETFEKLAGIHLPYFGLLRRNEHDITAFLETVGSMWQLFRNVSDVSHTVDWMKLWSVIHRDGLSKSRILKGLPTYQWDHDKPIHCESNRSRDWRNQVRPVHCLLGRATTLGDGSGGDLLAMEWRNIFKLDELPWLRGHQIENHIIFPAAGYLSMILDAAVILTRELELDRQIPSALVLELSDIRFLRPLRLSKSDFHGTEVVTTIRMSDHDVARSIITVDYACYSRDADFRAADNTSSSKAATAKMVLNFQGCGKIELRDNETNASRNSHPLPARSLPRLPLSCVETQRFYRWISSLGLNYSGAFMMNSLHRRRNFASLGISTVPGHQSLATLHPATLDIAFQGIFAAYGFPGDGSIRTCHVPSTISSLRVSLNGVPQSQSWGENPCRHDAEMVADCHSRCGTNTSIAGDVDMFCKSCGTPVIQMEELVLSPMQKPPSAQDSRPIFAHTVWKKDVPSAGIEFYPRSEEQHQQRRDLSEICERLAYFYIRQICERIPEESIQLMDRHFQHILDWGLNYILPMVTAGRHPRIHKDWATDTQGLIDSLSAAYNHCLEVHLLHRVGRRLPRIMLDSIGSASSSSQDLVLDMLMKDGSLSQLYHDGEGFRESNRIVGRAVAQIAHRYPTMRILEIGGGTGAATVPVLSMLEGYFTSYTFTDVSAAFFREAREKFSGLASEDKIQYSILNIEENCRKSGFDPGSYDLIIASNVLHATGSIANSLKNCRELLKSGGFLILDEVTSDCLYGPLIFSGLPSWWLGRESDGRRYSPSISETQWDAILRANGFSGVDHKVRDTEDESSYLFSVIVSQATNPEIDFLRRPTDAHSSFGAIKDQINNLVIISTASQYSKDPSLASSLQNLLLPFADTLHVVQGWAGLDSTNYDLISPASVVICLDSSIMTEDYPPSSNISAARMMAMQSCFSNASYVLWMTQGGHGNDPASEIIVGLCRSIMSELPHLCLRLIDVDDVSKSSQDLSLLLAETLLRMVYLSSSQDPSILWSDETELSVREGHVHVPRVKPQTRLNRHLAFMASHAGGVVQSVVQNDRESAQESKPPRQSLHLHEGAQKLSTHFSSLFAFVLEDVKVPVHLSFGHLSDTPDKYLVVALTTSNSASHSLPPNGSKMTRVNMQLSRPTYLYNALITLLCESLFQNLCGVLWLHGASPQMAENVERLATYRGHQIFLSTSILEESRSSAVSMTFLHPRISGRELKSLAPKDIGKFVLMSTNRGGNGDLGEKVVRLNLASNAKKKTWSPEVTPISLEFDSKKLWSILEEMDGAKSDSEPPCPAHAVVQIDSVVASRDSHHHTASTVIDWTGIHGQERWRMEASLSEDPEQQLLNIEMPLFSENKTYLLVGLASDLGFSLMEWMAGMGAHHFAVISRNPRMNAQMRNHLEKSGVILKTWAVDVSDEDGLREAQASIKACMPPVAGIVNGAMVLRDRPFDRMSARELGEVLQPKVQGTENLDKLYHDDQELEFFILFASATAIVGNPGQANYSAANLFMAGLAAQRRRRGVPASVLFIGTIYGVGHVAREIEQGSAVGGKVESQLQRISCIPLSEADLHNAFAEAVFAGRCDSNTDPEIIIGLGNGKDAAWKTQPRFSSWVAFMSSLDKVKLPGLQEHSISEHVSATRVDGQQSLRQRLVKTLGQSLSDGISLLEDEVILRLSVILQVPESKIARDASLISLGIDSLVAAELRSWFLKEVKLEVSVIRLLTGAKLSDICREALATFSNHESQKARVTSSVPSESTMKKAPALLPMPQAIHTFSSLSSNNFSASASSSSSPFPSSSSPTTSSIPLISPNAESEPVYEDLSPVLMANHRQKCVRSGPMSHAQARLHFLHQYLEDKSAYNVGYVGMFEGALDIERFRQAALKVCEAHESLRSCYHHDLSTRQAIQTVMSRPNLTLEHYSSASTADAKKIIDQQRQFEFDIESGQVLKLIVISHSATKHTMVFLHHHIALDGKGWFLLLSHLDQAYRGWKEISAPTHASIDIAIKQRSQWLESLHQVPQRLQFWRDMYQEAQEPLPLFAFSRVKTRRVLTRYETQTVFMELPWDVSRRIKQVSASIGVTSFHFCLSALSVFLMRALKVDDVSIGIVDANRPDGDDGTAMGYFLNMLPLRFRKGELALSFNEVAQACRNSFLDLMTHHRAPFDKILDCLNVARSGSHHPLFQVALDYRAGYSADQTFAEGKIEWDMEQSITARNPYDIMMNITPAASDRTFIHFTTHKYMYSASDSDLMMRWYAGMLQSLAAAPFAPADSCLLETGPNLQRSINLGKGEETRSSCESGQETLIHHIDQIIDTNPISVAVVDENGESITYSELRKQVMKIASRLKNMLTYRGTDNHEETSSSQPLVIATLLDPTANQIFSSLAILWLGLTCMGLDQRNPEERLEAMLADCQPLVIICTESTKDQACRLAAPVSAQLLQLPPYLSSSKGQEDADACFEVRNKATLDGCAVILYTSGSTGVPKGVLLSHNNLKSHITSSTAAFNITETDVILHQTSPGFDFSLDQIFHALANGGSVVVVPKEGRGDPIYLANLMLQHGVTFTVGCPSEYLALLNYGFQILRQCYKWRLAFSGGEKLTFQLRDAFRRLCLNELELVNVYGPTEVTIACARGRVPYKSEDEEKTEQSDYLYPMAGYSVLIVDESMNPLPTGYPGEIYIFGNGVTLGYLNRPVETEASFFDVANPWKSSSLSTSDIEPELTRCYRSGDYGRLLQDGSIHILGRMGGSGQVKIRGMRVELDEVANVIIRESDGLVRAAAVSHRAASHDQLVAFLVFDEACSVGHRDAFVKGLVAKLPLPVHMCPTAAVSLTSLPTNVNGKLDRAVLNELPVPKSHSTLPSPATKKDTLTTTESRLADEWRKIITPLETDQATAIATMSIFRDSDFFHIGGNSISAIQLRAILQENFETELPLPELFRLRTLGSMAAFIDQKSCFSGEKYYPIQTTDWHGEISSLLEGLQQHPVSLSPSPSDDLSNTGDHGAFTRVPGKLTPASRLRVLLTGANGFFGTHILQKLIEDRRVDTVHCVALRPGRVLSVQSRKIVTYSGDLSKPLLGMSPELFEDLSDTTDLIIHNGARVSFLEPYEAALRGPNVESTRHLCELALKRLVPLHFVSTAAVAGAFVDSSNPGLLPLLRPQSIASRLFSHSASNHLNDYALSKLVSEVLLESVSSKWNLPIFIHRVVNLVGNNSPEFDLLSAMTKYSRIMQAVPMFGSEVQVDEADANSDSLCIRGNFDFLEVETASDDLVAAALESTFSVTSQTTSASPDLVTAKYIHHCASEKVSPTDLQAYMERQVGQAIGTLKVADWLEEARDRGLTPVIYEYLRDIIKSHKTMVLPGLQK